MHAPVERRARAADYVGRFYIKVTPHADRIFVPNEGTRINGNMIEVTNGSFRRTSAGIEFHAKRAGVPQEQSGIPFYCAERFVAAILCPRYTRLFVNPAYQAKRRKR